MTLPAGTRLGLYEVISQLGSGGMGDVYRAMDTRLAREVALKVLHEGVSSDRARVKRFENEARSASALNHPNIVTIYDVGADDTVGWIAMERVEGRTLRQALSSGPIPLKRLLTLAVQIADGLARAHEAGIVHRDLKPENVMVTRDGLIKILDFGLAKLLPTGPSGSDAVPAVVETKTFPGVVVGTVGYMSPEQAQGAAVDHRSDQFSFGSILYEMATGRRAFQRRTGIDTLAAILNEEPEAIGKLDTRIPGPLRWLVERCLAKDPSQRYASTRDLARELEVLRDHLADAPDASPAGPRVVTPVLAAAAVLAVAASAFFLSRRAREAPALDFQRLTFQRGGVQSARFAPDGRTIVYSATWDGDPVRVFSARTDGRDSMRLALPDASVASVSSLGEIALLLGGHLGPPAEWTATLAQVPLTGGAPRELSDGISGADWSPDGKALAVARRVGGRHRLEFPIGHVLYESTDPSDYIVFLRVSPDGDRIAFWVSRHESNASVEEVDLAGAHRVLSRGWKRGFGLAWSPDGKEVWFSANEGGWRTAVHAVSRSGKIRQLLRLPSQIMIQDVGRDGRVLANLMTIHSSSRGVTPGDPRERDLSWHDGSLAKDLTADGKTLVFDEGGEGSFHAIYVRPTDGSPAKRIGEGRSLAISPDGRWVASNARGKGSALVLLPTGAGESRTLDDGRRHLDEATFFSDSRRILARGSDSWIFDMTTGSARRVGERLLCSSVSPDGKELACTEPSGRGLLVEAESGASQPIPGFLDGERVFQWSADGRALYAGRVGGLDVSIFHLDVATGRRELWRDLAPADRAAAMPLYFFAMTPDARFYAYSYFSVPSDLYLVTGLR